MTRASAENSVYVGISLFKLATLKSINSLFVLFLKLNKLFKNPLGSAGKYIVRNL